MSIQIALKANFFINLKKSYFYQDEIQFLYFVIILEYQYKGRKNRSY